jgi:hypothetical protein
MKRTSDLAAEARSQRYAQFSGPKFADALNRSMSDLKRFIQTWPDGGEMPNRIKAILWALEQWMSNPNSYSYTNPTPDYGLPVRSFRKGTNKCNSFVGDSYGVGAKVGFSPYGKEAAYPTGSSNGISKPYPVDAYELGSSQSPSGLLTNLPITHSPKAGDIISWQGRKDPEHSHTGLLLGNGLYISARDGLRPGSQSNDGVQITFIPHYGSDEYFAPAIRRYDPRGTITDPLSSCECKS